MIPDWSAERKRMVDEQLRKRGIGDERVLAAMLEIPADMFGNWMLATSFGGLLAIAFGAVGLYLTRAS